MMESIVHSHKALFQVKPQSNSA